ncbi:MAG: cellobiose phosphorylase [Acholeplasmatales bacterium]|nr:MAG: cellobiose phosphorylase [Acholeplasmatales bacterium]
MIITNTMNTQKVTRGGLVFSVLETGDIQNITCGTTQINLLQGDMIDGSIGNLYLRVNTAEGRAFTPLIGSHSPSTCHVFDDAVIYRGRFLDVDYQVVLTVDMMAWTFDVMLKSAAPVQVDVLYGQDIGLSEASSIANSEAYTSQYIDHKAFKNDKGYTLCARQNLGTPRFLQIGSVQNNVAFATDGFQFFGLSYKETGIPQAMRQERLVSEVYQYEFAYPALQSDLIKVGTESERITFYGYYMADKPTITVKPEPVSIKASKTRWYPYEAKPDKRALLSLEHPLNGQDATLEHLATRYPNRHHEEHDACGLLSFFTAHRHHVVLKQKELLVERPHGHLLIHGDLEHPNAGVMASTHFMFGVFSSHLVLGNTSFNKLLGVLRNPLNILKSSGQRIHVRIKGTYRLLGLPSYFDMGVSSVRWVYLLEDDTLTVTWFAHTDAFQQTLTIHSENGRTYDVILTHQLVMGMTHDLSELPVDIDAQSIIIPTPHQAAAFEVYPDLKYRFTTQHPMQVLDAQEAFGVSAQHGLLILAFSDVSTLRLDVSATFEPAFRPLRACDYAQADDVATTYFASFCQGFHLQHPTKQVELDTLNDIVFWYTHNALTHYASPHGLEQYTGAAWGTRDVCQGPVELFTAAQKFPLIRQTLLKVYQRQFIETGDFPQWAMYDRYHPVQATESHGDIIIWPLRTLAYYLQATHDVSILDEAIPYMSQATGRFTAPHPILDHVKKQIATVKATFIGDTHLPSYGGGDWDDTLQPADAELTEKMVSSWTVALLYESIKQFASEIKASHPDFHRELVSLADNIKADYRQHLIVDGVPAGFLIFNQPLTYLLHPRDLKTGLKYRLLSYTRAILADLVDDSEAIRYKALIDRHLKHPDGVRLMDAAITYNGGKQTYFTRGETAANFGREIGLQYVHAHIRYIEAMAKIGQADDAWHGLFVVNPILLQNTVPNALHRQSNVFFSSSDAAFLDRYQAKTEFDKLRRGAVSVKGGWRLYSSGPGIYIHQLICHILGVRVHQGDLVIDPVLPATLDGMHFTYHFFGQPLTITYHHGEPHIIITGQPLDNTSQVRKFGRNGHIIDKSLLTKQENTIHIDVWYRG